MVCDDIDEPGGSTEMRNVLTVWLKEDPAAAAEPRTCTLCNVCRRVSCGLPHVLRSSPLLVVSSFTAGWGCRCLPCRLSLSVCLSLSLSVCLRVSRNHFYVSPSSEISLLSRCVCVYRLKEIYALLWCNGAALEKDRRFIRRDSAA